MKIVITSRSGRQIVTLDISEDASVADLQKKFHALKRACPPVRQRFTLPPRAGEARGVALDAAKRLADYGLGAPGQQEATLVFKDLGPQVGYSTVFFWEYFGPLVVYPLFWALPHAAYAWHRGAVPRHPVQAYALAYWSLHYAKRILETFTIHKFGHATMPLGNLLRNCGYYWGYSAFVSYFINHPAYTPPPCYSPRWRCASRCWRSWGTYGAI